MKVLLKSLIHTFGLSITFKIVAWSEVKPYVKSST